MKSAGAKQLVATVEQTTGYKVVIEIAVMLQEVAG
jgi:hypothetical protein